MRETREKRVALVMFRSMEEREDEAGASVVTDAIVEGLVLVLETEQERETGGDAGVNGIAVEAEGARFAVDEGGEGVEVAGGEGVGGVGE